MPKTDHPEPRPEIPRTCSQIAEDIRRRRKTTCAHTTVWTAARRLSLIPALQTPGGFKFYSAAQAKLIEAALTGVRSRSKTKTSK